MEHYMNKYIGPLLILIAAVSWSTAGLFTRVVTTDIPTTLFWRSLFGGMCVLVIVLLRDHKNFIKECLQIQSGRGCYRQPFNGWYDLLYFGVFLYDNC